MRILGLLTDAFGGYGGISVANRHFLRGLCAWKQCDGVVALPRLIPNEITESMPDKLDYRKNGLGGKAQYAKALITLLSRDRNFGIIWCGHINLVPLALLAKKWTGGILVLHIHGIDAWEPTHSRMANWMVQYLDYFISVSEYTKQRFLQWAPITAEKGFVLPNTIDFSKFSPGSKDPALLERYGLKEDHYVLMTLGRLAGPQRKKGFDRVLEVLPEVLNQKPKTRYLIAGKGPDRARLEQKAEKLGVREQVVFTGYIPEEEKQAHYRLADRFVMPSEGEGFGLVLLEAMACGVPVIGSSKDGTQQALADGKLGMLIDPGNKKALKEAILHPMKVNGLNEKVTKKYNTNRFEMRASNIFEQITAGFPNKN